MKSKKILKIILKALVSLGFLYLVIIKVNWLEVWYYLQKISFWQMVLYISIVLFGMMISSYKWKLLANFKGIKLSHWDFFKFYLTGTLINNVMPSFVGGDAYRAYQIGRPEKKYTEAASSVMMDRITGFVGATILSVLFAIFNFRNVIKYETLVIANILLLASFFIDIALAKMRKIPFLKEKVRENFPAKVVEFLQDLFSYNRNSKILMKSVLLGAIFSFVGVALSNWILFWALDIQISIWNYLSAIFLVSIVSSIPISINNIGIKEWAYVVFFGIFGISSSLVLTVALLSRFLQMVLSLSALPIYIKNK
jgi:hypothetical protein